MYFQTKKNKSGKIHKPCKQIINFRRRLSYAVSNDSILNKGHQHINTSDKMMTSLLLFIYVSGVPGP